MSFTPGLMLGGEDGVFFAASRLVVELKKLPRRSQLDMFMKTSPSGTPLKRSRSGSGESTLPTGIQNSSLPMPPSSLSISCRMVPLPGFRLALSMFIVRAEPLTQKVELRDLISVPLSTVSVPPSSRKARTPNRPELTLQLEKAPPPCSSLVSRSGNPFTLMRLSLKPIKQSPMQYAP